MRLDICRRILAHSDGLVRLGRWLAAGPSLRIAALSEGTPRNRAVRLDVEDRGVATVTMRDTPGRNAMSGSFVRETLRALAAER